MRHLIMRGGYPPPWEYVELVLCRDVYHCTPSQLRQEQAVDVLRHLTCIGAEGEASKVGNRG